jgi:hypothetical protein
MYSKKNKAKPDPVAIKTLFKETGLLQKNLIVEVKKYNLKFSLRQYQRALEGIALKAEVLNSIAIFFDRFLKENKNSTRNITINDIIENFKNDYNQVEGENKRVNKEDKKTIERCYLHRIETHDQITEIIKKSAYPKIFYPFNPSPSQINLVKKIIENIKTISSSFKKNNKRKPEDTYDNLDEKIKSLDIISGFTKNIEDLKKEGVYLYSNNFIFSYLYIALAWTDDVYEMFVRNDNYAIFCFQNQKTSSITFEYENFYPKEQLEKFVKEHPLELHNTYPQDIAEDQLETHYESYFKNKGNIFDEKKINLSKTDVYDLITDEEYNQIGEDYKKTEEENLYDDSFDPRD